MMKVENLDHIGLFSRIITWRMNSYLIPVPFRLRWTALHLEIVFHYYKLITCSRCEYSVLPSTKLLYDNDTLLGIVPRNDRNPPELDTLAELVVRFTQELREFFMVPRLNKMHDVSDGRIKRYQAVEVFISFLLQLLCYEVSWIDDPLKERIGYLEKELRFLRTVLGDASFLYDEHLQGINNLLPDFEAVANEAGSLVHSLLFSTDLVSEKIDEFIGVLLNHTDLLKANIMSFLDPLPLSSTTIIPRTSVLDSLLFVGSLLDDLEVLIKREDDQVADVKDQIQLLHQRLITLQSSIKDIGVRQRSEIGELKELFMRIGDMACQAEYLIISFMVGDAPPAYLIIRLTDVICNIELIGTELQEIKKKYEIGALKAAKHFNGQLPLQAKRKSEVDVITVGLEDKEIHILEHLVGRTQHLQIISITGMPGLGKTTFAKKLYNHPLVNYRFDRCLFCVISQSYEKKSVLLDILNNPNEMSNMGEQSLVEHLHKTLKGRRYLVVMDDLWDSNVWYDLKQCFPNDENGSRILITSRNKDVAPPDAIIYELPFLTNEECWDLLEMKVFHDEPCSHELLRIGKKIAANCCGLPLTVVVVAGVLSTMDKDESKWRKVGENLASFIFDGGDDTVMQILDLSYRHLPEHLRRCFLYLGVFSECKQIPVQELMMLWIAEGFIIKCKEQQSAESVAEEYLMELIVRNLAIVSKRRSVGGVKTCVVHDLLWDLCLRKCEEENFLKFVKRSTSPTVLSKSQRLVDDGSLSIFDYHQNLRSFHAVSSSTIYASNMKLLRVLNFNRRTFAPHYSFGIKSLVCLRYLCTEKLPECIASLVNLEFLFVVTLEVIPSVILEMTKLRKLQVWWCTKYDADCNSSQRNNLEFLSTIKIENLKDEEMLKCSPHLRKLKCKCDTLWEEEKGAYRYPDLRFLTELESLNMSSLGYGYDKLSEIHFPPNIKKLTLSWEKFSWEKIMKAVGRLPKLEVLKLVCNGEKGETWETRGDEFQQLKFLKMENLLITQWHVASSEHFPRLQQLVLIDCLLLEKIPSKIGDIASLQLIEIGKGCKESLMESARNIQKEQREMANEELRVIIKDVY